MPTKTVLITGAAGYLGSVLSQHLLEAGFAVRGIDCRADASPILSRVRENPQFEYITGDVCDRKLMAEVLAGVDAVIPTAAIVGAAKCDKDQKRAWEINFESIKLLNDLRQLGQQIVFPMTNNGYQSGVHVTEDSPWADKGSLYTQSKFEAEQLLLKSQNTVSLRLASLFGVSPSMRWDLLIHFLIREAMIKKKINLFDAHFKRSFVHVKDVADCFVYAVQQGPEMQGIYNVALEKGNLSKQDVISLILEVYPEVEIKNDLSETDPDSRDFFISTQKLQQAGFKAVRTIREGVSEVLNFLQTQDLTLRGVA